MSAPNSQTMTVRSDVFQAALNYIRHVGANHVMRGEAHPQQWLVDALELTAANQPAGPAGNDHSQAGKPAARSGHSIPRRKSACAQCVAIMAMMLPTMARKPKDRGYVIVPGDQYKRIYAAAKRGAK